MNFIEDFKHELFHINEQNFEMYALTAYDFQYHNNETYGQYCDSIHKSPARVKSFQQIPFLPIEFYKNHAIVSSTNPTQKVFKSSGTTSTSRSEHHVKDLAFYHLLSKRIFQDLFAPIEHFQLVALLPSYLEQGDSSLISMVDHLLAHAKPGSGYYLEKEISEILQNEEKKILFGVPFALLDLPEIDSSNLTVIETGGMKGRKKEITRKELHRSLAKKLNTGDIWSEYGMTELFSQAYGKSGVFQFPKWASIRIREINDPFSYVQNGKSGGINVIDLANIETCAFIETKDIGIVQKNGHFEVLGRFDNSDIRGCSLLV